MAGIDRFAVNDGVKIHYLDTDPADPAGLPVVFVPGVVDVVGDYAEAVDCFAGRRLLLIELRGRGDSDAPAVGYSSAILAGDVRAVVEAAGIDDFHLMTFSRGTTPALLAASDLTGRVRSCSIGDYLPAEIALPAEMADRLWSARWRGTPNATRVGGRHVIEGIQAESRPRELWTEVADLGVPVLVARGGSAGAIIDDQREAWFRERIPGVEIVTIEGSGHDIFRPSRTAYPRAVVDFIARRCPGS